ncbi:dimethylmenaquinone methyltransferase [Methylobacterium brachythecii]|uniref:3',5'-cyclic-nucleotide phosphodiesterase n=1 Tax=Methylobacterium brachythecii TaxID=1176177 RepID=A0A7W6ALJ4_9HYPH|nr:dimethylmenaquinone methyltransferase [Methylobacterium brachythecii]MBB3905682.1 oligoribonuclease NrnB/cAMP/cGMP phosphodiesterase (DHH superfamily) [Methylobacterium brachythecii]GLS47013.1 3',5'-cyclic-nucleotide phosphodiesterase [Methylobacterium brachythecii]
MDVTQISHHDLDGYGACVVAGYVADVKRVVHVPRYSDVGAVLQTESERLAKASAPELLLVTDLSLEADAVQFIKNFAAANLKRPEEQRHRLVVLDHHISSVEHLSAKGLTPLLSAEAGASASYDAGDSLVHVIIDTSRCATRMVFEHRALIADRTLAPDLEERFGTFVAAVDAYDMWRTSDPAFRQGVLVNEVLWESASAYVPPGHPWHDQFITDLLMAIATELQSGASPSEIELRVPVLRKGVVDALLQDEPGDDRSLTMRARLYAALSHSPALFRTLSDGTKLSFGLDGGVFQAVSDHIMGRGDANRIINAARGGGMSFRSRDGSALETARKFRGGGHADSAGGKLPNGSAFSLADAAAQIEPILCPPAPNEADSPFAALKNWKS